MNSLLITILDCILWIAMNNVSFVCDWH